MGYWVYTGINLQEANEKANIAINLIDEKGQEIFGGDVIGFSQTFNFPPTIDGIVYYCGFQAPPPTFINGATCDLITEWEYAWFEGEV